MNHKQITDLFRQNDWGQCASNKIGIWFEFLEDYVYGSEFDTEIIPKGTKMQFIAKYLTGYSFRFEKIQSGFLGIEIRFGRSRLLKCKLKEIA